MATNLPVAGTGNKAFVRVASGERSLAFVQSLRRRWHWLATAKFAKEVGLVAL